MRTDMAPRKALVAILLSVASSAGSCLAKSTSSSATAAAIPKKPGTSAVSKNGHGDKDHAQLSPSSLALPATPTGGQINFRTKTRNGIRGLLPKSLKLRLWGKKAEEAGLDNAKRLLHITSEALVLEVEGEDECLSIARGPESLGGAKVTTVRRGNAGITPGSPGYVMSVTVDGLFGIYDLLSGPFLAVIKRSKLRYANRDLGVEFRQVSKVRLIPILAESRALDEAEAREEARLLALLALAFRSHQFYFSHAHDVTQTLQNRRVSAAASSFARGKKVPASGEDTGGKAVDTSDGAKTDGRKGRRHHRHPRQRWAPEQPKVGARDQPLSRAEGSSPTFEPDQRFFWNLGVLGALRELRDDLGAWREGGDEGGEPSTSKTNGAAAVDRWMTPVMSGFLQVERGCRVGKRGFDVLFVSRRSRLRQGTRFTRRGIDDGGNVANFVETEQSLLHEDLSVTSHVQIRGSIPVLWSSPTNLRYHPKVRIDPDEEASLRALRRHSEDLIRLYGKRGGGILFVNLVDKKKEQGQLGEVFDAALKAVTEGAGREGSDGGGDDVPHAEKEPAAPDAQDLGFASALRHVWFDFHHECRNMHWENLDKLLAIVDHEFSEQGFYHAGPDGETLSLQDGVVRTNCMDCLDRTNVVQSLLARRSMLVQLHAVGVDVPDPAGENSTALALTLDMLEMPAEELEHRFRDVWGNNADEISMLYAGTPALKGDFTRTGQRTKLGLLQDGTNSAIRYVVNNFQDHRRQEAVDVLLGVRRPSMDPEGNILNATFAETPDLDLWTMRLAVPSGSVQEAGIDGEPASSSMATTAEERTAMCASEQSSPSGIAGVFSASSTSSGSSSGSSRSVDGGASSSDDDVMSVGLADGDRQRQEAGGYLGGRALSSAQAARDTVVETVGGGEERLAGATVERVAGAALKELRMAGPYSALALAALFVMAVGGSDLATLGARSASQATALLLLAGLASLPLVLSVFETR